MTHKKHLQELRAKTRAMPEEEPEFQIAPMIDILLVLLVFFMSISTTEVLRQNKDVVLPVAKEAKDVPKEGVKDGEIVVNITWNDMSTQEPGKIIVDDATLTTEQLASRLDAKVKLQPMLRVVIRADRMVKFDYLKTVMKSISQSGVSNVIFSVTNKEAEPAAASPKP